MGGEVAKSLGGSFTTAGAKSEMNRILQKLPAAECSLECGIPVIKLRSLESFFSIDPLDKLGPAYLGGKMTMTEYMKCVESVNNAICDAMVGLSKTWELSDVPQRHAQLNKAAVEQVRKLNELWKPVGVTFCFDSSSNTKKVKLERSGSGRRFVSMGPPKAMQVTELSIRIKPCERAAGVMLPIQQEMSLERQRSLSIGNNDPRAVEFVSVVE
eukprot:gnl/Spiro4/26960_TR13413_c0_g1_i1.p1 gnl/Spiro4/26960_TR13413_c0_g1~~gnl/Spiro4/26960_TR13413_c0_g1_i1.p1  ORF type:complete len:224 (+),score=27.61 gnl/Spiro4/26960_TR13413_c0_g1_i1:36-674(+)